MQGKLQTKSNTVVTFYTSQVFLANKVLCFMTMSKVAVMKLEEMFFFFFRVYEIPHQI